MKKKLALLLSAIMVVGMIPMTAFAASDARINKVVTGKVDTDLTTIAGGAPVLVISGKDYPVSAGNSTFQLVLENAEWKANVGTTTSVAATATLGEYDITILSANRAVVEYTPVSGAPTGSALNIPLDTILKGEGQAKVTIAPENTVLSAGTYVFANIVTGSTTTTIEKLTDIEENGTEIKAIVIQESVVKALNWGSTIQVRLTSGFEFKGLPAHSGNGTTIPINTDMDALFSVTSFPVATSGTFSAKTTSDPSIIEITLPTGAPASAATIAINGLSVKFDDADVDAGDIAEITLSGAGLTRATLEVGTARTYGVTFKAENKTLPVFYSGRADKDIDTLKVTFEETIVNSWLDNRKTTITFPDGVKVDAIDVKSSNLTGTGPFSAIEQKARTSVVTFSGKSPSSAKAKVEVVFTLSIAADFTGDIVATLGGAGVGEDMEVVIGTAVAPFAVEAETNEVNIDYREVTISDIIITEADTGLFERDKVLTVALDYISFDGKPSIEVVEGDIKIESIKTREGKIEIEVKTATQRTPAVLKISDLNLFLQRSIPAGSYELSLIHGSSDTFFQNYAAGTTSDPVTGTKNFKVSEVVILKDYVEVVTAGRDQDDSTFTTTLTVTIGADTLTAGKQVIALDVPAYISEGYTMLPVRAVTEALSGAAIVRWDDTTKTVTITFGSRVISMTVGSKTMNINGVPVQMSKACEITESRSFIPLRDLGYALGLNDSKINWDDATKTASLN